MIFAAYALSLSAIQPEPTPIVNHLKSFNLIEKQSGLENIDCIYVLNLDHRPERWERTKQRLNDHNCHPNRVGAINGWELSPSIQKQLFGPYSIRLNGGPIGCLLGHVSIYKNAYENGFNIVWICEDDIEITRNLQRIPELIDQLTKIDPDWDILYTDHFIATIEEQNTRPGQPFRQTGRKEKIQRNILRISERHGTHSMIFSRKGLKKVLDYFTHVYLWSAIDVDIHYVPTLREYSVKYDIVTAIKDHQDSDIEGNRYAQ